MVFLHQQLPSRKRERTPTTSSFVPPPKIPKPTALTNIPPPPPPPPPVAIDKMLSILAEAGVTLLNPTGPPCLPSHPHNLPHHLHRLFSSSPSLRSDFLSDFSSYIHSPLNLRRVLASSNRDAHSGTRSDSLVKHLLLVPSIQLDLQNMLLDKLPEFFDAIHPHLSLEDDVARLIINHFRWLDFVVDPNAFTTKLMQVLSISPLHLKKEIVGSLPEIIPDHNYKAVVDSLQQMLQEDSTIIVPVLDSFSNLNLDDQLQEQVITIALSCIRTIDAEHMPYLLRFLLLSASQTNVRRIISQIREQLKFVGVSHSHATKHNSAKGKSLVDNTEASILDALRSSLRFKNILCQEILKELDCLDKPQDHKVIDLWLLLIMYMNGESLQKRIQKIFKKKIIDGCIQRIMFDHCIRGNKILVQDYFPSFLSLTEYLLACKEQKAREFGIYLYSSLFEEYADNYSRQEVLGALVTHVGTGVSFEVSSALETLALLASKYALELIPLSSHVNGILDYLEGFSVENLHKVYEVFSHLALSARSSSDCFGSSIANELLMIIRKQVSHPDLKYKKMGLIGTLKIVSCLGDASIVTCPSPSQKSNCEEALELLKTSMDSCKQLCLPLILFYDEMTAMLEYRTLQPSIMEWIGKHVGEFESIFLSDLESGQLPIKDSYCGLEGELWMNLDGDISPICLNILPLASSSLQSSCLQTLPANFLLLSAIERLTNQGSLGGIDALLGCPLHLPSSKYFFGTTWQSLTGKQKQIVCLSLFYAANWIRELLNAFCTQVAGRFECAGRATGEDIIDKILKRLRNLVFLESLLNHLTMRYTASLPELHFHVEQCGSSPLNQPKHRSHVEKNDEHEKTQGSISSTHKRKQKRVSNESNSSHTDGKLRQPTILDVLRKAGAGTSPEVPAEDSFGSSSMARTSELVDQNSCDSNEPVLVEVSALSKALQTQRFKFRPLRLQCFSILTYSKMQNHDSCCPDPAAELPLHLYLLRDIHFKLDYFTPPGKLFSSRCMSAPTGFTRETVGEFLSKIRPLLPSFKRHFDSAVCILKKGDETCQDHWQCQCTSARNPDIPNIVLSNTSVSTSVFKEVLHCFSKLLNLPDVQMDRSILSDLLGAFQPVKVPDGAFSEIQPIPSPGTIEYLYLGVYSFVEGVLNIACSFSFMLASESLLALESAVTSLQKFLDKSEGKGKYIDRGCIHGVLPILGNRLETSAQKLLRHGWNNETLENGWKNKGDIVRKILLIYLENSKSTLDLLDELACSILPQVSTVADDHHGFPTLCPATFAVWYRVLHEVNLTILNKLVKEVVHFEKRRAGAPSEAIKIPLIKIRKSVNVLVSLVNTCRTHSKVVVHAMAVNYGGKFVDSFLKAFDFLQASFQTHTELIINLVKELQKATRTIQTLCSEAKSSKQTIITSKIPATKRSMERFLFHVKVLLHTTSSECTFWMGNLKHKDLMGQVVSSQAYADDSKEDGEEDTTGPVDEDEPANIATEDINME